MARGAYGGRRPPGVRRSFAEFLSDAATTGKGQAPYDYILLRLAIEEFGVPVWELTKPLPPEEDLERLRWVLRGLEFRRMRASVKTGSDGSHRSGAQRVKEFLRGRRS